jgi:arabinofuranosyltransferase
MSWTRLRRDGPPLWLPIAAGIAFYAVFVARTAFKVDGRTFFSLFDDGMISMRYGRNLAHGHGLVWNPGQTIEGYSNFLWTVWMAALHLLGLSDAKASLLVMLSGLACLVGTLLVLQAIGRIVFAERRWPVFAVLLLTALYYPLAYWSLRGMEVGFVALCLYGSVLLVLRLQRAFAVRDVVLLGAALAAAALTRDDAIVPGLIVLGFALLTLERRHQLRVLGVAGGLLVVAVVGHEVFRLAYYGELVANTYHLKLEGVSLGVRLERGLAALGNSGLALAGPAILAAAGLILRPESLRRGPGLLALVFVGHCAYSVYVGGDAWETFDFANRFLTPGVPALIVLAVFGLDALTSAPRERLRRLIVPGAAAFAVLVLASVLMTSSTALSRRVGDRINAHGHLQPGAIILVVAGLAVAACALVALRSRRVPSPRATAIGAAILGVLILGSLTGRQLVDWTRGNAQNLAFDQAQVRYGVALKRATTPNASIAITWAGAPAYFFDDRRAVDLFGKVDRHIAEEPSHMPWRPGHTKWDVQYSIRRWRPDVLAEMAALGPADRAAIVRYGYRPVPGSVGLLLVGGSAFARAGSPNVDVGTLAASYPSLCGAPIADYCVPSAAARSIISP